MLTLEPVAGMLPSSSRRTHERETLIRETLSEFSLAEIIRLIAQTRRTGVLEVSGPASSGRVLFRDGTICGAESSRSREPLGRKLVRSGDLSERQLWNYKRRKWSWGFAGRRQLRPGVFVLLEDGDFVH